MWFESITAIALCNAKSWCTLTDMKTYDTQKRHKLSLLWDLSVKRKENLY